MLLARGQNSLVDTMLGRSFAYQVNRAGLLN